MTLTSSDLTVPAFPMPRAAGCPFDPPPALGDLQHEAALTRVQLWDGSTPWLVTRYAEQRALLADPRVSADITRPGYPSSAPLRPGAEDGSTIGFILMDDPEHARLRRMVTAPFAIKRIEALRPGVQRIVDDLIDNLLAGPRPRRPGGSVRVAGPVAGHLRAARGPRMPTTTSSSRTSRKLVSRSTTPEERGAGFQALHRYLDDLLARKTAEPGDDLLSELAARAEAGELTRGQAAGMGVLLLIAGHETTANMIALGTLALLENPDQLALLRDGDDPKLVAGAVEELLRYLNITHGGRRRVALADIEIAGHTIRAGEGLIMANDIGNRDATVFDDPDRLDLERDARRHVAFGFGIHQCLGQPLARMELQVVYSTLYRRIPDLRLATGLDRIPFKHDAAVYGVHELPVTW